MKKIILVIGGVIFIAIAGRAIWAWQQVDNGEARVANTKTTQAVLPPNDKEVQNVQTVNSMPASTICDNYQCLIFAASQCQPISATVSYSGVPFPFDPSIVMSGQTKYEIKKSSGVNDCVLIFSHPGSVTFGVSDEGRKAALAHGVSDAQITAQLQKMNDSSKLASPSEAQTTCSSNAGTISEYLTDTKNGNSKVEGAAGLTGQQISTYTTSSGKKLACTVTLPEGQPANTSATISDKECTAQKGVVTAVTNTGTACSKDKIDIGTIVGGLKLNKKYPQCCVNE